LSPSKRFPSSAQHGRSDPLAPPERDKLSLAYVQISSYNENMRRRQGSLLPLEVAILEVAIEEVRTGTLELHGFAMAKKIRTHDDARRLTAHGTLYKALARMERARLLESRWEDPATAAAEERPRRRLYRVTGLGEAALAVTVHERQMVSEQLRPGWAIS